MSVFELNNGEKLFSIPLEAFKATYFPVGYDQLKGEFSDGHRPDSTQLNEPFADYLNDPLTLITSFLGLPNRKPPGEAPEQSFRNIFNNFVGWQSNAKPVTNFFNTFPLTLVDGALNVIAVAAKVLVATTWHLVTLLPRLAVNCLKLVTEFLPRLLDRVTNFYIAKLNELDDDLVNDYKLQEDLGYSFGKRAIAGLAVGGSKFALGVAHLFRFVASAWLFAGTALSSPIHGVERAWNLGEGAGEFAMRWLGGPFNSPMGRKIGGKLGAFLLAAVSGGITLGAYLGGLYLVSTYGFGFALKNFPISWLQNGLDLYEKISPALDAIGNVAAALPFVGTVAAAFNTSPALLFLSVVFGLSVTTVGLAISKGVFHFTEFWSKNARSDAQVAAAQVPTLEVVVEEVEREKLLRASAKQEKCEDNVEKDNVETKRVSFEEPAASTSCYGRLLSGWGMFGSSAPATVDEVPDLLREESPRPGV